jgi:uncharacterized membrane protein YeiB
MNKKAKMKYKWIKMMLVFIMFTVMTCILVTADREASVINNREPMTELRVTRVSEEMFSVSFLGYSRDFEAGPFEKMWKRISQIWYDISKINSERQQ